MPGRGDFQTLGFPVEYKLNSSLVTSVPDFKATKVSRYRAHTLDAEAGKSDRGEWKMNGDV